jgi:pre-mRNA-splicing factor ATP-dependent RNA helicase DHX38/PRP16
VHDDVYRRLGHCARHRKHELLRERQMLPIFAVREPLMALVKQNAVLIVVGETGSGKSTRA